MPSSCPGAPPCEDPVPLVAVVPSVVWRGPWLRAAAMLIGSLDPGCLIGCGKFFRRLRTAVLAPCLYDVRQFRDRPVALCHLAHCVPDRRGEIAALLVKSLGIQAVGGVRREILGHQLLRGRSE